MIDAELIRSVGTWVADLFSTELVAGLGGALIGGYFTRRATLEAHKLERNSSQEAEDAVVKNTLSLIRVELATAWAIYQYEYVGDLESTPNGAPLLTTFPIGENPFPIYDSAPTLLASAPPEITSLIVRVYMRMKGLIRMIEMNNAEFELAKSNARDALLMVSGAATWSEGRDTSGDLQNVYDAELSRSARLLGMEYNVPALKDIAVEIAQLISQIVSLIGTHLGEKANASANTDS